MDEEKQAMTEEERWETLAKTMREMCQELMKRQDDIAAVGPDEDENGIKLMTDLEVMKLFMIAAVGLIRTGKDVETLNSFGRFLYSLEFPQEWMQVFAGGFALIVKARMTSRPELVNVESKIVKPDGRPFDGGLTFRKN